MILIAVVHTVLGGPGSFLPVEASQTSTTMSQDLKIMCMPSGENATDVTLNVCPCRGDPTSCPVDTSQMHTVLSEDPETMCMPSGENATDVTRSACPCKVIKSGDQLYFIPLIM